MDWIVTQATIFLVNIKFTEQHSLEFFSYLWISVMLAGVKLHSEVGKNRDAAVGALGSVPCSA